MKTSAHFLGLSVSIVLCAAACGGTKEPAASPSQTTASETKEVGEHDDHHKEGADHDKHHADLSPALKDFHGVIGPVWHSGTGAVRVEKACNASKSLQEKAKATGDAELVSATDALDASCGKDGKPEVEAKLTAVHERFHKLAEKH